jgi:hypothetical protein
MKLNKVSISILSLLILLIPAYLNARINNYAREKSELDYSQQASNYWLGSNLNIWNTNSGNVGIGLDAPQAKLHVMENDVVFSYEDNSTFILEATKARFDIISHNAQGGIINFRESLYGSTGQIATEYYLSGASPKHRMNFLADTFHFNNKIGIGTEAPQAKLHVTGNDDNSTLIVEATQARIDIISQNAQGGIINFRDALFLSTGAISTQYYLSGQVPKHRMNFSADHFFFNNQVGINVDSPLATLHVNGTIRGQYSSSDGSQGITQGICFKACDNTNCCINIKNGIIVETTCSDTRCPPGGGGIQ